MAVVGESFYQDALCSLASHCVPGPEGRPSFQAVLVAEPDNPYDSNAIAVHGPTGKVGHLSKEDAVAYGATFRALSQAGFDGGSCTALLNGGQRDKPNYGVVLTLAFPEICEMHLGVTPHVVRSGDHRGTIAETSTSGHVRGKHYTTYTEEVRTLKRHGHDDSAETLLLELVDAVEAEAAEHDWGVAPWYYEQLAIIYRKRRDSAAEIAILERFEIAQHAPGVGPGKLAERLEKARLRAAKETAQ